MFALCPPDTPTSSGGTDVSSYVAEVALHSSKCRLFAGKVQYDSHWLCDGLFQRCAVGKRCVSLLVDEVILVVPAFCCFSKHMLAVVLNQGEASLCFLSSFCLS